MTDNVKELLKATRKVGFRNGQGAVYNLMDQLRARNIPVDQLNDVLSDNQGNVM